MGEPLIIEKNTNMIVGTMKCISVGSSFDMSTHLSRSYLKFCIMPDEISVLIFFEDRPVLRRFGFRPVPVC